MIINCNDSLQFLSKEENLNILGTSEEEVKRLGIQKLKFQWRERAGCYHSMIGSKWDAKWAFTGRERIVTPSIYFKKLIQLGHNKPQ